eukprot:143750-Pyramimonas_sp.AAC.1
MTKEDVGKDESLNDKMADFEQKLAVCLQTLRQTLDESNSSSLEEFVLAVTQVRTLRRAFQVSKEGIALRDAHYKSINLKEQGNFRQQIEAQEKKVAKLTEEIELCVPHDD